MVLLIGLLAAAIVISVITKWWVDGLVSATETAILSAIYGGLVFGLFAVSGAAARLLVLVPLLGSAIWALYLFKIEGLRHYHREKIAIYQRAIQADPANMAARSLMAEAYYRLGDLDSAIAAMELAVQVAPNAIKEGYQLRQWQQERELRDSKIIVCQNCHSQNLWGESRCRTCLFPLVYPPQGSRLTAGGARSQLAFLGIGVVWLVFSILAFVWLPLGQAGVVVACGTLASVGWILLASSKP